MNARPSLVLSLSITTTSAPGVNASAVASAGVAARRLDLDPVLSG
jgi:hypothetical protein